MIADRVSPNKETNGQREGAQQGKERPHHDQESSARKFHQDLG